MRPLKPLAAIAATLVLSAGLSGCITLLPKQKPVQLYRFAFHPELIERANQAATPDAPDTGRTGIALGNIDFPQDSAGDRIVTVEGSDVSYIADARWTEGAQGLFNDAVSTGFARSAHTVALQPRGPGAGAYRLDLSVRKFETDYQRNHPTVSIAIDARIIRASDRSIVAQRYVTSDIAVKRNDMSQMVDGYNEAVTQAIAGLIGFSEETVANDAGVTPPPPPAPVTKPAKPKGQKVEGL